MQAALPMYDFPHLREAWTSFYRDVSSAFEDAPELSWGGEFCASEDVFLTMTCGAPFRNGLHKRLHLVGTLDFGFGQAGYYHSVLVGNFGERVAVNDEGSQSGYHAVMPYAKGARVMLSGAHLHSLEMVLEGKADFCGVDAVSYRYICQFREDLAMLPILGHTEASPGLPLVTSDPLLVMKLTEACAIAAKKADPILGISGLTQIPKDAYLRVKNWTQSPK